MSPMRGYFASIPRPRTEVLFALHMDTTQLIKDCTSSKQPPTGLYRWNKNSCKFSTVFISNLKSVGITLDTSVRQPSKTLKFVAAMSDAQAVNRDAIIGLGRVGQALLSMGNGADLIVRRGESVPRDSVGPIFVCTRNDSLDDIVDRTPENRKQDLIFLQNGMIEPWLESKGLERNTQLLVYFAVAKKGEKPIDGITSVNPEGLTAVTGKWADEVASRLRNGGLSCKVLSSEQFQKSMLEKLIWICSFMLVGVKHPGASVGDVESLHTKEVVDLIQELVNSASKAKNVEFDSGVTERLLAYAKSVAHYPTAVKEFEWRNGWFYEMSKKAVAEGRPDPNPIHTRLLREVGAI